MSNNEYYAATASAAPSRSSSGLSRLLSKVLGFGTIHEEVDRVPTPTTASILKKSGYPRVQGRKVHFFEANDGVTELYERPKTLEEDISALFYSEDDKLRFINESYYHMREYKKLRIMGVPSIDCLSAFPGDEPPGRTSPYTTATAVFVDELREAVTEEDELHDNMEERNEEELYDTVVSVENREEGDCDTSFIQPRRIVKAKRSRISKVNVPAAAPCINKVLRVISHERQMESLRPMRKRIRISQDNESVSKEAALSETSSEVVSPPCPPSRSSISDHTDSDDDTESDSDHYFQTSEFTTFSETNDEVPSASSFVLNEKVPGAFSFVSPILHSHNEEMPGASESCACENVVDKSVVNKKKGTRMLRELESTLNTNGYWREPLKSRRR